MSETTLQPTPHRTPIAGTLGPNQSGTVSIDPPLTQNEAPLVVTWPMSHPHVEYAVGGATVRVHNTSPQQIVYVISVIPLAVDKVMRAPWRQAYDAIKLGLHNRQALKRIGTALGRGFLRELLKNKDS